MYRTSLFLGLFTVALLTGCAPKTMYHWGSYDALVYHMYVNPDEATAEVQLEALEADIEKARSKAKPLPPGFRAHMGYLYFQLGRYDEAKQAFEAEKIAFPESSHLMDRFLNKLN